MPHEAAGRPRCSLLIVPGSSERMIQKAATLDTDCVIFDLEDGVAPEQKPAARSNVAEALRAEPWGRRERSVRINGRGTGLTLRDLLAIVPARPDVIVVPMVQDEADLSFVSAVLDDLEAEHGIEQPIPLLAVFETPRGVLGAEWLSRACPRLAGVMFGAADFTAATRGIETLDHLELDTPRHLVVMAAASVGLPAYDTPFYKELKNLEALRFDAERGRRFGFVGKVLIHPSHLPIVNDVYRPSAELMAWAEAVLAAFEAGLANGRGAVRMGDEMIDAPMVARARDITRQAGRASSGAPVDG